MRGLVLLVLVSALAACGGGSSSRPALTVFAAASLGDAFQEMASQLEAADPDREVVLNLAGSHALAAQILAGARADLFASASPEEIERVEEAGLLAGEPVAIATTTLAIAVEPGNPEGLTGLADLSDPDLVLVLAAEEVPAGRYALRALERAGVRVEPDSLESDVRSVLGKVALGEADAGIVYRSDLLARPGEVEEVAIPPEHNVTASYLAAVLATGDDRAGAERFLQLLSSGPGRDILARHGLSP